MSNRLALTLDGNRSKGYRGLPQLWRGSFLCKQERTRRISIPPGLQKST